MKDLREVNKTYTEQTLALYNDLWLKNSDPYLVLRDFKLKVWCFYRGKREKKCSEGLVWLMIVKWVDSVNYLLLQFFLYLVKGLFYRSDRNTLSDIFYKIGWNSRGH